MKASFTLPLPTWKINRKTFPKGGCRYNEISLISEGEISFDNLNGVPRKLTGKCPFIVKGFCKKPWYGG